MLLTALERIKRAFKKILLKTASNYIQKFPRTTIIQKKKLSFYNLALAIIPTSNNSQINNSNKCCEYTSPGNLRGEIYDFVEKFGGLH